MKTILVIGVTSYCELVEAYNSGNEIEGFYGSVMVPVTLLSEDVPVDFPNSQIVVMVEELQPVLDPETQEETGEFIPVMVPELDENEEPVMRQKTWGEYSRTPKETEYPGIVEISVGWLDNNKNLTHIVEHEEFASYVQYFGLPNMKLAWEKESDPKPIIRKMVAGAFREVIGISPTLDSSNLIAITVNNAFISPLYEVAGISVNPDIVNLINSALATGATTANFSGLPGHTTYLVNVDNLIPAVMVGLLSLGAAIHVDWLQQHELFREVDAPHEDILIMNNSGTAGLIPLRGESWEDLVTTPGLIPDETLFWDKYTVAKLATAEYSSGE